MPIVRVPVLLKYYLENATEVTLSGATVAEVLAALCEHYPKFQPHLFDDQGRMRRHINLFVNQDNIRDLEGLQSPVREGDVLRILPSITGG